jgi:hypothetical protein
MDPDKTLVAFEAWIDQVVNHKQNKQWGFYDGIVMARNKLKDLRK